MPRRLAVTDELSVIAFGSPPSLVVELAHVAEDGAVDQHNHGLHPDGARALRAAIATAPFAWRASSGGFEIVSRTGGAGGRPLHRDDATTPATPRSCSTPPSCERLREAVREALSGSGVASQPARNDPCPCGSGLKYKRCCGR